MALISTANFYNTGKRNWLDIAAPASPDNSGSSKKQKTSKGHDRTLEESFVELQALNARVSAIAAEISRLHHTPSVADEGEDDSDHTCDPFDFEDPPHHDTLPDMEIDVDIEIDILGNSKVVQKKEPLYSLMSQQELIHIISHLLPTEKLGRVIDIVSESSAAIVTTPTDEVEFDLSALDPITFGELSDYIHLCMCELNGIPTVSLPKYTPPKPASLTSSASSKSLKRLTQKNKKSPAPKASSVNKNAAATATAAAVSPSVKGKSLGKRKRSLSSSAPAPSTPAKSSRRTPLSTPTKKKSTTSSKKSTKVTPPPSKKSKLSKSSGKPGSTSTPKPPKRKAAKKSAVALQTIIEEIDEDDSRIILLAPAVPKVKTPEVREVFKLEQVVVMTMEDIDEDELVEIC